MKLNQKIKALSLTLLLCGLISSASAQKGFKYEASVNKVNANGFYKISLPPNLVAKSNADLSDIRIVDKAGNFVPYISGRDVPQVENEEFVVFPQVPVKINTDTGSVFIVENKLTHPVDKIWVKLKNTAVNRTVNILGSEDLKKWYAIEEDVPLQQAVLNNDGSFLQSLAFPGSTYHYLKILVNDKNKAPVKFLEAGIYHQKSGAAVYNLLPSASFSKKDSGKTTYLSIILNDNYRVDLLKLQITAPKYYNRDIAVYIPGKPTNTLVCSAALNSAKPAEVYLSARTNKLELQINNEDNLPLNIAQITLFQEEKYIISYLEAGKDYRLLTGNKDLPLPDYDLKFFKDSIHNEVPNIGINGSIKYIGPVVGKVIAKRDYTLLIWIAVIIALILLTLLTLRMAAEVNKKSLD